MKVLIVEDDINVYNMISLSLSNKGYVLEHCDNGSYALELIDTYKYDIVILDLNLPDMNGMDILKYIRKNKLLTPVLILSGDTEVDTRITTLDKGADDYLTKPFSPKELSSRIQAIIRRTMGFSDSIIKIGRLSINLTNRVIKIDDNEIHLTNKEYLILELLAIRKGKIVSKELFLNHLYDGTNEPDMKTIDVFICKIRKTFSKFLKDDTDYISTVWGQGYTLKEPVTS